MIIFVDSVCIPTCYSANNHSTNSDNNNDDNLDYTELNVINWQVTGIYFKDCNR